MIGVTVLVIAALCLVIWVVIEIKRMKHKLFAIFLIFLLLFSYLSFLFVFKDKDTDFTTVPGLTEAGKLYFSWLGSVFGNLKSVTSYTIQMDWEGNSTLQR